MKARKVVLEEKGLGSEARVEHMSNADADLQLLNEAEQGTLLQKRKKCRLRGHEDDVLARLEMFKRSISAKPNDSGNKYDGDGDEDLFDWKAVPLTFAPEHGKDNMSRKVDPNDYVVHDPLLETGKEKLQQDASQIKATTTGMGTQISYLF